MAHARQSRSIIREDPLARARPPKGDGAGLRCWEIRKETQAWHMVKPEIGFLVSPLLHERRGTYAHIFRGMANKGCRDRFRSCGVVGGFLCQRKADRKVA